MVEKVTAHETTEETNSGRGFPALVAKVVDEYTVVINRGQKDGVKKGQIFLIYGVEGEVNDPESGESLGHLEVVRGRAEVTHVQEKMATIKACQKTPSKIIKRRSLGILALGPELVEESNEGTTVPFEGAIVGDKVKQL